MYDVITVGSATVDAFIETDNANIVSVYSTSSRKDFMAYPYGAKIEIDNFEVETGGGGLNAAANFSSLGLNTSTIIKIGEEIQGQNILKTIEKFKINKDNIIKTKIYKTGFSIILISFQGDRTVLAHRGANAHLNIEDINFDSIKNTKWLYLAPLNGSSTKILDDIADFTEKNNIKLAINIGTSSIKQGKENLEKALRATKVLILNKDEATMLTGIQVRPDTKTEKYSDKPIHPDIIAMLDELNKGDGRITIITDGKNGAYAFDSRQYYHCNEFPAKVVSTLGAGDAFASTFVASIDKTNGDTKKSLMYASVVAASIVEHFSAQEGFLTFEEIEERLNKNPDFKVEVFNN